ncbi:MAG: hypothetical protein M1812_001365 [Candelaria pacifica]|nr:MAG: hypothetical protein M1812_001365 [Candelaria pacifica]
MTQVSPTNIPGATIPKRPKGILKNSYQGSPPINEVSPTNAVSPPRSASQEVIPQSNLDPTTDKDVTLQNTLQNAGHRRTSSNARTSVSRRQSSATGARGIDDEESNPRLKWDEANLYLTEQEKSSTMKIDEPKTPYAQRYDPDEDEAEMRTLDADDLMVDELDKAEGRTGRTKEDLIPGLDIGEPEEAVPDQGVESSRMTRSGSLKGEKQVVVDPEVEDGLGGHGEPTFGESLEEREKHRKFEEMRKKHYEMKDVKGLLGYVPDLLFGQSDDDAVTDVSGRHPEELEALEDEEVGALR